MPEEQAHIDEDECRGLFADLRAIIHEMDEDIEASLEKGCIYLVRMLLPSIDNFDRALLHLPDDEELGRGLKMISRDLHEALAAAGIESFAPLGEDFNPDEHEALSTRPALGIEPGRVLEVSLPGYRCKTTIIRPAQVIVSA